MSEDLRGGDSPDAVQANLAARIAAAISLLDQPSREEWDDGWGWTAHEALDALRGGSERSPLQYVGGAQALLAAVDNSSLPPSVREPLSRARRGLAEAIVALLREPGSLPPPAAVDPPVTRPPIAATYLVGIVEALRDALKADDRFKINDTIVHLKQALDLARRHPANPYQDDVFRTLRSMLGCIGSSGLIPSSKHEVMGAYADIIRRAFRPLDASAFRAIREELEALGPLARTLRVHIMHEGMTLCRKPGVPGSWRDGDTWIRLEEASKSNCPACIQTFEQTVADPPVPPKHDIGEFGYCHTCERGPCWLEVSHIPRRTRTEAES